jgi:acyl carrier protein
METLHRYCPGAEGYGSLVPGDGLALNRSSVSLLFRQSAQGERGWPRDVASKQPQSRPIALRNHSLPINDPTMPDRQQTLAKVLELIAPFNKKGIEVSESTRFAQDLEWDSLTVLDFVANIEDEFDVIISMNMQAEIETVGQLVDALEKLTA